MTEQEKIAITKYDLLYEQRMTRVETNNENTIKVITEITSTMKDIKSEMKSDFMWLLGAMVGLAAIMAHGFKWF